jgi:hypothetical protein
MKTEIPPASPVAAKLSSRHYKVGRTSAATFLLLLLEKIPIGKAQDRSFGRFGSCRAIVVSNQSVPVPSLFYFRLPNDPSELRICTTGCKQFWIFYAQDATTLPVFLNIRYSLSHQPVVVGRLFVGGIHASVRVSSIVMHRSQAAPRRDRAQGCLR